MTTRKESLQDLLAKVEAGTLHKDRYGGMPILTKMYQHFAKSVEDWKGCGWSDAGVMAAYHGSLDAAKALHEAVLPGWTRAVDATAPECGIEVKLYPASDVFSGEYSGPSRGCDAIEARAWLIAIIKALIAQEPT